MKSEEFDKRFRQAVPRKSVKRTKRRRGSPVFSYPGSKWKLMPEFMGYFPPHDHYVSVFGGSATDILAKPPSKMETYNDLDRNVYNVFRLLQNDEQLEQLVERVLLTPSRCKDLCLDALDLLKGDAVDPVDRAWAFCVVAHQSIPLRSASIQEPTGWRCDFSATVRKWDRLPSILRQAAVRFRNVQIINRDWAKVVTPGEGFDRPATFFFADPQYHPSTIKPNAKYYFGTMSHADHERLLAALTQIEGKAMVCGYDCELYREVLANWRTAKFAARTSLDVGGSRNKRAEFIWMNYDPRGRQLERNKQ